MDASKNKITYLSKETTEGQLHEQSDGRFELLDDCGKYIAEFSCGIPIEIFLYDNLNEKEIWQFGRVESRQRKTNGAGYENEYYFKNGNDNPALKNSMKARVRD